MNANPIPLAVLGTLLTAATTVLAGGGHGHVPAWDSGTIAAGGNYSRIMFDVGTIQYHCHIHPGMVGTIQVEVGDGSRDVGNVSMNASLFQPASLTILRGGTVRWSNNDSLPHTVTEGPEGVMRHHHGFIPAPGTGLLVLALGALLWAARRP